MEPFVALGRLERSPGPVAVGVTGAPRLTGVTPKHEKSAPWHQGPQGHPHLNGCVPLSHQVAGHKYGVDKVGILQHPDGTVLKQLQPPPRGPREMHFYSMVYAEDCCDPCLLELRNYLPKYYGTCSSPENSDDLYLKLEDVTRLFNKPCIMDVKLGQRSYDPFASQAKREQQIRKYPLMEEIGFLLLGMRIYNVTSDSFDSYDQHYGRRLQKDTVKEGLAKFFHNGVALRKDAVLASIGKIHRILCWFEAQQQLCFYASSLLFVYEGLPPSSLSVISPSQSPNQDKSSLTSVQDGLETQDEVLCEEQMAEYNNNNIQAPPSWDYSLDSFYINQKSLYQLPLYKDQQPNKNRNQVEAGQKESCAQSQELLWRDGGEAEHGVEQGVEVRMIDFAHVFPSDSHDQGYIYGLKHLLSVLQQILQDSELT